MIMRSRNILALVSCLAFAAPVLGAQQAASKAPAVAAMAKDSGKKTTRTRHSSKKAAAVAKDTTAKTAKAKTTTPKK
jgi:hypothetical protein